MVSPMSVEPTTLEQGLDLEEFSSTRRKPKKRQTLEEAWLEHFYSTIQYKEDMGHLNIPLSYVIESQGVHTFIPP